MSKQHNSDWWQNAARKLFEEQHRFHSLEFDPDYWPRDPNEYTPTTHFLNKKRENRRCIEGRFIRECIEEGKLFPSFDTKAVFGKKFAGVKYYLTVGAPKDGQNYFEAITMYPWVWNKCKAVTSGMWTQRQVEDMRELNREQLEKRRSRSELSGFGLSGIGVGPNADANP